MNGIVAKSLIYIHPLMHCVKGRSIGLNILSCSTFALILEFWLVV